MLKFLYILVILYNLNLLLNCYTEVMVKIINLFNYKNTTKFTNNYYFYDTIVYNMYKNKVIFHYIFKLN